MTGLQTHKMQFFLDKDQDLSTFYSSLVPDCVQQVHLPLSMFEQNQECIECFFVKMKVKGKKGSGLNYGIWM